MVPWITVSGLTPSVCVRGAGLAFATLSISLRRPFQRFCTPRPLKARSGGHFTNEAHSDAMRDGQLSQRHAFAQMNVTLGSCTTLPPEK